MKLFEFSEFDYCVENIFKSFSFGYHIQHDGWIDSCRTYLVEIFIGPVSVWFRVTSKKKDPNF